MAVNHTVTTRLHCCNTLLQPQRSANAQSKLDHGLCVICLSSAEMATAILAIMPQGDR